MDSGDDSPCPRLCHIIQWDSFDGFGFNLHAEKNRTGQFIGKVDEGSPADVGGLKYGDRIIEVNGVNIANENHKQVVGRIKAVPKKTKLLVVDDQADKWYKQRNIVVKGTMEGVIMLSTPVPRPGEEPPTPPQEPEECERLVEPQEEDRAEVHETDQVVRELENSIKEHESVTDGHREDEKEGDSEPSSTPLEVVNVEKEVLKEIVDEVEAEKESVVEIELKNEVEVEKEIKNDPEVEMEIENEHKVEIKIENEPEAQREIENEPKVEIKTENEPEAQREIENEPKVEIKIGNEPEFEKENESKVEIKIENEPEVEKEIEPKVEKQIKSEIVEDNNNVEILLESEKLNNNENDKRTEEVVDDGDTVSNKEDNIYVITPEEPIKDEMHHEDPVKIPSSRNSVEDSPISNRSSEHKDTPPTTPTTPLPVTPEPRSNGHANRNGGGLNLNMSAKEMRELLSQRKKKDVKQDQVDMRTKYMMVQKL